MCNLNNNNAFSCNPNDASLANWIRLQFGKCTDPLVHICGLHSSAYRMGIRQINPPYRHIMGLMSNSNILPYF